MDSVQMAAGQQAASGVTIAPAIRHNARLFANRPAVVAPERTWTYRDLDTESNRLANAIAGLGISRGERVALLSENRGESVVLHLACAKLGVTVVALNMRLHPDELAYCVGDSNPRAVCTSARLSPAAEKLRSLVGVDHWISVDGGDGDYRSFDDLLSAGAPSAPADVAEGEDIDVVVYTSGTTGRPKGAMLSQRAIVTRAVNIALWLGLDERDGFVGWPPLYHIGGYEHLHTMLLRGGTFVVLSEADPEQMCRAIDTHRATYTLLLPGVATDFLRAAQRRQHDVSSLEVVAGYANLLSPAVIAELTDELQIPFHDIFGQTETSYIATGPINPGDHRREHKRPMPNMDLRIAGTDLEELPVGVPGECVVRGPNVASGYVNNRAATEELFRGGWLHTGDVCTRNDDGTISFTDRQKYLIKTGGENVYPAEVEQVIAQHEAVQEVCVIGLPDEQWGETVKAFVVTRPGHHLTPEEVTAWCGERLAGFKKPRLVEFLTEDELPRSVTGKIMREPLAARSTPPTAG
jgi:fatty-acyl-CoA synthase